MNRKVSRYSAAVIASVAAGGIALAACSPSTTGSSSDKGSSAPVTHAAAPKHHKQTVTYVVSGSSADVTYGPSGSDFTGHVPMDITAPLRSADFYSITAQLGGSGSVTCEIKVNNRVVSRANADGGYNIASCEISQDPFSGKWTDTNSGA